MSKSIKSELLTKRFAEVEYWKTISHQAVIVRSALLSSREYSTRNEDLLNAFQTVFSVIYTKELEAYKNLLLFTNVMSKTQSREARKMALRRFYREGMGVMRLMSETGADPSSWNVQDEELVREVLAEIEKEPKDPP